MMLGRMEGRRGRGRQHFTWLDNLKKYLSKDIINLRLDARDRAGWRIATMVHWTSPGVGFDSTAQGNKVYLYITHIYLV